MSLDIKYRPRAYSDVLGQESTITILRRYVSEGKGFQQSYLFCGAHGSGKTTLGRILARALLCENPKQGDPCDDCTSCKSLLTSGSSADFIEVDAATNSGKADVTKITEEIAYSTFSGKRRIYLFDEAHQMSKDALDALLKPLEDNLPGSNDKKLTCIFCTTEPEKMRVTILSRCAPAFVIQPQKPEHIAQRLAHICDGEGIEADPEMLVLIAEMTECHIRDALKAVEGVSMLGAINKENVAAYLHLDLNTAYIDILDAIGVDLPAAFEGAKKVMGRASPLTCYEKLAEVSMLAFRASLGEGVPAHWGKDRLKVLGDAKGAALLGYASRFASRPGRPTAAMLLMDIAHLHHVGGSVLDPAALLQVQTVGAAPMPVAAPAAPDPAPTPSPTPAKASAPPVAKPTPATPEPAVKPGTVSASDAWGIEIDQRAVNTKRHQGQQASGEGSRSALMSPEAFANLLGQTLLDLEGRGGRPPG